MFYLVTLKERLSKLKHKPELKGVKYNIVKRPLSGGRHTIRKHAPTKRNLEENQIKTFIKEYRIE